MAKNERILSLLALILGLIALAIIYRPALQVPFLYDDLAEIVQNTALHDITDPKAVVKYNPARALLMLSFATEWHFFANNPLPFHITNLLIHLLNAILLTLLCKRVIREDNTAQKLNIAPFIAGLLFLVHPLFVESVTYIASRSSTLCTLFYMATLLAFSQYRDKAAAGKAAGRWYALTALSFILAISTKEIAATLPAALLLFDVCLSPRQQGSKMRWILPHVAPWVALGGMLALRILLAGSLFEGPEVRTVPENIFTEIQVIVHYLYRYLVPFPLSIYHDFKTVSTATNVKTLGGLLLHVGLIVFALQQLKHRPQITFALLWFYLTLTPTSSFIPLKESMAEHRTYLPGVGLFTLLTYVLNRAQHSPFKVPAFALSILAGLGFSYTTYQYNLLWEDEIKLWHHATELAPHSADAQYALGDAYRRNSQVHQSIEAYETSIKLYEDLGIHLKPTKGEVLVYNYPDALNNLGLAYAQIGKIDQAITQFRKAARAYPSLGSKAYTNLGYALMLKGQYKSAEMALRDAVESDGNSLLAHLHLANLYYGFLSNQAKSLEHYRRVLAINPNVEGQKAIEQRIIELSY